MEYTVIRHPRRKNILITVTVTGEVIVKAGVFTSARQIDKFVNSKREWIESSRAFYAQKCHTRISVTAQQKEDAKKQLLPQMKQLTEKYAAIMDVKPLSVKITGAEKRWGSCSGKKSICYSYRLAFVPQRCREYVAVHELSHIKYMNHSKEFYKNIEKYMPDYKEAEKELNSCYIHAE